ncbi:Ash2-trithorax family protein [Schizosaccharomyces japonicus yFS275]|uniref:Ash2-trithorax family protein n=1 Tax=Schizosaccharomyces japonicus (strain yFS275 / FY16936) TaxID=402676 RepID=B6JWX1_SCHJY|nr:Ash2-trithorax family protein [Schizosaccharomyces japonicus yFS275]EEB05872.1 Ash2-trithorax family protein [Schizosaccharomyces japonicus yFS275]
MDDGVVWNASHTLNNKHSYCYCGADRNLCVPDLQCSSCHNMFHLQCLTPPCTSMLGFSTNYRFLCKNCSEGGIEQLERGVSAWKAVTATAMANLVVNKFREMRPTEPLDYFSAKNMQNFKANTFFFQKKVDLIPYVEANWHLLCPDREKVQTWQATLGSCLVANKDTYRAKDESQRNQISEYALANPNLFEFRSGYISPFQKIGAVVPMKRYIDSDHMSHLQRAKKEAKEYNKREPKKAALPPPPPKRQEVVISVPIRYNPPPWKPSDFDAMPKPPMFSPTHTSANGNTFFTVADIPFNRPGFRYTMCEAARSLPSIMYRQIELPPYRARINWHDTSEPLLVDSTAMAAYVKRGFRMARANVFVNSGEWYFEVRIEKGGGEDGAHVRVGVARREAPLDAPVGYDAYSYGLRDTGGQCVHLSRPTDFMKPFGTGDVLGFHICLPTKKRAANVDLPVYRDRIPIRYKGQLYFEQLDYIPSKSMDDLLVPLPSRPQLNAASIPGSFIKVYKNGVLMGTAFSDLLDFRPPHSANANHMSFDDGQLGYFPAISMFGGGIASFQFGPHFSHVPAGIGPNVRPICERYDEQIAEDVLYDMLDEIEYAEDAAKQTPQTETATNLSIVQELKEFN